MGHRPLQALAQQFHKARLLLGHGPGGDAQQAGYLRVSQPLFKTEAEDAAVAVGQCPDAAEEGVEGFLFNQRACEIVLYIRLFLQVVLLRPVDEDTEETYTYTIHVFGNTQKEEDATLVIEYDGELEVDYYNPKNEPAEVNPGDDFETITPLEVVDQFLGEDIEDILDQYNNLMENNGMYMAFMDENELLMGFALNTQDRIVTSIVLLYNEDLSDEDIIDYYTKAGYTCTDTGEVDEEEETPIYLFSNPNTGILITYSGLRGVATQLPQ